MAVLRGPWTGLGTASLLQWARLAASGPDGPSLVGLELRDFIQQNRLRDNEHLGWIAEKGDELCDCPEESNEPRDWYIRLIRVGALEGPHRLVHQLCDESRSWLEGHIDFETWGRQDWRTDCEPQVVALCVLCGISLAARGEVTAAIQFFVVAIVTLHLSLLGCYDRSQWPFLVDEILENFSRLLEEGSEFRWVTIQRPFRAGALRTPGLTLDARHSAEKSGSTNLLELALRLRQAMGLVDSLVHVHQPKVDPEGSGQLGNFEELHERGPGFDDWTHADLCAHGREVLDEAQMLRHVVGTTSVGTHGAAFVDGGDGDSLSSTAAGGRAAFGPPQSLVRVLNACSGMFAPPREVYCDGAAPEPRGGPAPQTGAGAGKGPRLEITSVDRSARAYVAAFARHGWSPRSGVPQQCDAEELWRCFPRGVFDIVHVRNGLDHTVRPLQAIEELVRVTKPGGRILLWHWWNEHPEAWKGLTSGPHQWAFDLCPSEDVAAAPACAAAASAGTGSGPGSAGARFPLLWNYAVAYNLSRELAGRAALLSARFEEDPLALSRGLAAGGNRYVVLEFRRLRF